MVFLQFSMTIIVSFFIEKNFTRFARSRGGRLKKGRSDRNSDARQRRSYRSNSVRGVGCEEQEKI